MNATPPLARCAGAPRDLGLDQGRAFATRVREQLRARVPFLERARAWLREDLRGREESEGGASP